LFSEDEPALHKRQPLAVAVVVSVIDIIVVVFPVACPRVIRRIDVDAVDLPSMGELERLEYVVVFAFNDDMRRLVTPKVDRSK
jgi:hypothetical protein